MSFRQKDGKFSAYDGKTERVLSNTYTCVITNLTKKGSKETRQVLVTEAHCRICFKVDQYRSHFEISILVPRGADGDKFYTSYLRLDAQCSTEYVIQAVENDIYKSLCGDTDKVHKNSVCYRLSMRYDHTKLCAENIFSEYCPAYVADLRDYLRKSTHIAFFINGSLKTQSDFDNLNEQLGRERKKSPLLAWYPSNMKRPVIQKGMYLKHEERPKIEAVQGVYTYFDWPDYMTRHGYGHIYEQECIKSVLDPFTKSRHEMFFFELPGGSDRRVMFFLRVSSSDIEVRLMPGDNLHVFFDDERDITKAWNATIMDPLPYSPLSTYTGYITRPWDKENQTYKDNCSLQAVPWSSLHTPATGIKRILEQPYLVGLKLKSSDKQFSRSLSALEHLNRTFSGLVVATPRQKEDLMFLLGNHYDTVRKVDMYESVAAKLPEPHAIMELNEGQLATVMKARSLPAGWLVIHGPPGTGKTYLIGEMLKPFFVDDQPHRILVCSANNHGVDNTARRAHQVLTKLQSEGMADSKRYIVRLHSLDTEKEIVEKDAKLNRPIPHGSRPKCVQEFGEEEREILERLDLAKLIVDEYEQSTQTQFAGIHDKRVVEIEMSLGHRMLQVAGLVKDKDGNLFPWAQTHLPCVANFVESYRIYNDGEEMDRRRSLAFKGQTKELAGLVMNNATVLACTLATATSPQVTFAYNDAEGIAMDEAAKVMESDLWPLLQHYNKLVWKLLVGDPDQLGPVIQSTQKNNPFFYVIKHSLMVRLLCTGATYHLLTEQSRAIPQLAEPYNHVVYDKLLTHAPSTNPKLRPVAQAIRKFNLKHFNRNSNIIYVDLTDGEAQKTATGSVYNNKSCQFGLNLLELLLNELREVQDEDGMPCNIAILTGYQAQYRCYQSGIQKMSKAYPQVLEIVDVDKIDRRQGSEWHVVIVDLARTEKSGFLKDKARLNVLFSRAKDGMFIIVKKELIDDLHQSQGKIPVSVPSLPCPSRRSKRMWLVSTWPSGRSRCHR